MDRNLEKLGSFITPASNLLDFIPREDMDLQYSIFLNDKNFQKLDRIKIKLIASYNH